MSKKLTNEEFINRLNGLNKGYIALDEYKDMNTFMNFQCTLGHIWPAKPNYILNMKSGCPYCTGQKVLVGFNDLWTTNPEIARLLKNPEDGYKYSAGTNKRVEFVCPICGNIIKVPIYRVKYHGLYCQKCSDGVSYPNKFARAFLDQLPIENFEPEYQPDWAKPYFYDNYFSYNDVEYILEMDGSFHYFEKGKSKQSLEERQEIDALKDKIAEQHNIKIIRIECMKSDCEYIKNNILSSEINNIFDLSNIDWDLCDKKSQRSLVKEACDLFMTETSDIKEISKILHIGFYTVYRYLNIGKKFGWCDYDAQKRKEMARSKISTPVVVVDDFGNIIHSFPAMQICEKEMKAMYKKPFERHHIKRACESHIPYYGFNFRFLFETVQN